MRLFPVVAMVLASPAVADRAAFELAPDLSRAEHVFFGTVVDAKSPGAAKATVVTPLKGPLGKGQSLEGQLVGDEFMTPRAPKGTVLVVARDGRFETFGPKSFPFAWVIPTLGLLNGSEKLDAFKLKTVSRQTAFELLHHVFGHEVIPLTVREAAMRELLARAKPDWEVDFLSLPDALRLPSLATAFVEYFTRFPRAQFSSAARWEVFRQLRSRDAAPYLLTELEQLRTDEDANVLRYALEALAASDPDAARCAFHDVLAQGGLWLGREASNREAYVELRARMEKRGSAACPAFPFRRDLPFPTDAVSLRRVAFFSDDPALPSKLVDWSRAQKDASLAESALWAAGRVAERAPQTDSLERVASLFAAEFKTRGAPVMHGASGALTRLINRSRPALFDWLLLHPTPMSGAYGKPDDLLDAVVSQLDWSDEQLAKDVLGKLIAKRKVPGGIHALHQARPGLVRGELGKLLSSSDAATLAYALALGGRAGLDAIPLADVAKLMGHANAGVRAEAVTALSIHLVGSEQYSRGVPHFTALLERLEDDDASVRAVAVRLVAQLAVKGNYPQYANATPELKTLVAQVRQRAAKAKGERLARLNAALTECASLGAK